MGICTCEHILSPYVRTNLVGSGGVSPPVWSNLFLFFTGGATPPLRYIIKFLVGEAFRLPFCEFVSFLHGRGDPSPTDDVCANIDCRRGFCALRNFYSISARFGGAFFKKVAKNPASN